MLMKQDGAAYCIYCRCNVVCGICSPCRNQIHGYDFSSSHPIADGFQEPPSCELPKQNTPDVKIYTAKVLHRKAYE